MSTAVEQEGLVKESLFQFVKQHIPNAQLSCLDEFVLSYVVSIVEEVAATGGAEAVEGTFDAEAFIEVLSACFPAFANCVESCHVTQWMADLQEILLRRSSPEGSNDEENTANFDGLSFKISEIHIPSPSSISLLPNGGPAVGRVKKLSETSEGSCDSTEYLSGQEECSGKGGGGEKENGGTGERDAADKRAAVEEEEEEVRLLQEMFPGACCLEVRHCLAIAGGDLPRAAQLVLHRQEAGQSLTVASPAVQVGGGRPKVRVDDRQLKERIIARYSYIDHEEDKREHRPVAPKAEPKKLIRYRDNKIVSIKGERFTEVRKEEESGGEAGGDPMKKTYVSLKPARQYRFH
ncbi:CUE domain-containing protein 2 [Ischnura elegans]|uniref:CUE domain-containing protein 2 n=1 Tax=Ischnura elegans TaxID=197161 RepID=UPI001ED8852F|nr:CUE domain-containing protein 2 [Ischnura elegans]XP_046383275.1 CUE domain-containing protein 2 [Ischnura elegans]